MSLQRVAVAAMVCMSTWPICIEVEVLERTQCLRTEAAYIAAKGHVSGMPRCIAKDLEYHLRLKTRQALSLLYAIFIYPSAKGIVTLILANRTAVD